MRGMLSTMSDTVGRRRRNRVQRRPAGTRSLHAAVVVLISTTAGCTSSVTTSDGRPMPPVPHAAPQTPSDSKPNAMAMLVGFKPTDTDGNNYPDLITVQTYLYSRPHPTSIYDDGAFVFELYKAGGTARNEKPLLTWRFEKADVDNARMYSRLFERGYTFKLSLLEHGSDRLPLTTGNLIGRFEPADGSEPIRCVGVRTIQIGKAGGSATASAQ